MEESRAFRVSDEIETIKFREQTNGTLRVLEAGQKLVHDCIDRINMSLSEFKLGLGVRVDAMQEKISGHDTRLARIETSLDMIVKVTWVIATCSVGVICTAFYKLILR